jgi:hypothetical protein
MGSLADCMSHRALTNLHTHGLFLKVLEISTIRLTQSNPMINQKPSTGRKAKLVAICSLGPLSIFPWFDYPITTVYISVANTYNAHHGQNLQ